VTVFSGLFDAGDRIALGRPGYPAYRNALKALNREAIEIDLDPADGYTLTASAIERLPDPVQGVVVASPANPTGATIDRAGLTAIARLCDERNITLVSDEIYHGVTYDAPAVSALEVKPDAIVINSFSKFFRMPGWRLGWLVVPEAVAARLSAYVINFFLTPPTLAQRATLAAFDDQAELEQSVVGYRHNRDRLLSVLAAAGLPHIVPPSGAFYLYADVSALTDDSLAFCHRLLEDTGIATAPGLDFDPIRGHGFMRLSFALRPPEIEEAAMRLQGWLKAQPRR
jgi:aspartate/methionine/tyrosine aminotransferase